jgi:hypothetical protein
MPKNNPSGVTLCNNLYQKCDGFRDYVTESVTGKRAVFRGFPTLLKIHFWQKKSRYSFGICFMKPITTYRYLGADF